MRVVARMLLVLRHYGLLLPPNKRQIGFRLCKPHDLRPSRAARCAENRGVVSASAQVATVPSVSYASSFESSPVVISLDSPSSLPTSLSPLEAAQQIPRG